jgi:hypothetical protein
VEGKKEQEKYGKVEYLPSDVWGFNDKYRDMLMMKSITFIVVCYLVVILRNGEWNELTGHLKDRRKDNSNLGRILSNLGRMMKIRTTYLIF